MNDAWIISEMVHQLKMFHINLVQNGISEVPRLTQEEWNREEHSYYMKKRQRCNKTI